MKYRFSRRIFIASSALASLSAGLPLSLFAHAAENSSETIYKDQDLIFLFHGDSITDGNRGRNTDPNHIMGHGYAFAIASRVGADFPASGFTFYNRGISGNTVPDL
jgi:hypothetical protein